VKIYKNAAYLKAAKIGHCTFVLLGHAPQSVVLLFLGLERASCYCWVGSDEVYDFVVGDFRDAHAVENEKQKTSLDASHMFIWHANRRNNKGTERNLAKF
jgi:hypothetical protein